MPETLPAFNGTVTIPVAGTWPKQTIITFFNSIRDNPDTYDVEANSRTSLSSVVEAISTLVTNNAILRDSPLDVTYQGNTMKMETLFDFVGWIFSVAGTSPSGATRENYYWPLAGLYSCWFRRLLGGKKREPGKTQITWFKENSTSKIRVALGGNLDNLPEATKNAVRGRRADQLVNLGLITAQEKDTSFVDEPQGSTGQKFGHCAETFPFLFVKCVKDSIDITSAAGFAVTPYLLLEKDATKDFVYNTATYTVTNVLDNPCPNCEILINKVGLTLQNFRI